MSGNRFRSLLVLAASCLGLIALLAVPSGAAAKDRNHDRIPDRWEKAHHLSLGVNQAHRDQDNDNLDNRDEFLAGDNPRDADTDNDGTKDGNENAGRIDSFDAGTGRLVIGLFSGDKVTGLVNDQTEIDCADNGDDNSQNDGTDDRRGDNSGSGSENSGQSSDDNGDNQGTCSTADLQQGALVQEAELHTEGGSAVFEKVELGS